MADRRLGDRLSAHVSLPKDGSPALRLALTAIDRVHGVPSDAPIVPISIAELDNAQGQYWASTAGGPEIVVDPGARFPCFVLTHEVAHYLVDELIGSPDEDNARSSPLLERWRDAIHATGAVRQLQEEQKRAQDALIGRIKSPMRTETLITVQAALTYALRDSELFARSYTQFVAMQSGEGVLQAEFRAELFRIRAARLYLPTQWEADDFAPVAGALEDLLIGQGWME